MSSYRSAKLAILLALLFVTGIIALVLLSPVFAVFSKAWSESGAVQAMREVK